MNYDAMTNGKMILRPVIVNVKVAMYQVKHRPRYVGARHLVTYAAESVMDSIVMV
jgi:hypothetical protein